MRIAHVTCSLSALLGGSTAVVASLAKAQAAAGHKVTVIPASKSSGPQTPEPGVYEGLTVRPGPIYHHLRWYNRQVANEIRQQIHGNDIVHIHSTWRYHLLAAAHAARSFGIPYIISPHGNLDYFCYRYKWYLKYPYFMLFERAAMNQACAIHCCTQMEQREISAWNIKARKFVVPNSVDVKLLDLPPDDAGLDRDHPELRGAKNTILFLGRFHPKKRLDVLIDAFGKLAAEFPDWQLVLAGPFEDQGLYKQLTNSVKSLQLQYRIFMPGMIVGQKKAALLRRSQIYAHASADENFCVSVAEAMLFGVPCAVSRGVALAEDVEAGNAGLVTDGTVEPFARSLRELMKNTELRKQFGANGAEIAGKFSPEEVERAFTTEYQCCIENNSVLVGT